MINIQKNQSGAVLVVSLVILLILTILGVSVMRTTTLEEKMAAATRDKDLALQAAEAALAVAEIELSGGVTTALDYVFEPLAADEAERWNDESFCGGDGIWACGSSKGVPTAQLNLGGRDQPRFFIEVLQTIGAGQDKVMVENLADFPAESGATYYRVTAIGYGGTSEAQVVLQSTYGI